MDAVAVLQDLNLSSKTSLSKVLVALEADEWKNVTVTPVTVTIPDLDAEVRQGRGGFFRERPKKQVDGYRVEATTIPWYHQRRETPLYDLRLRADFTTGGRFVEAGHALTYGDTLADVLDAAAKQGPKSRTEKNQAVYDQSMDARWKDQQAVTADYEACRLVQLEAEHRLFKTVQDVIVGTQYGQRVSAEAMTTELLMSSVVEEVGLARVNTKLAAEGKRYANRDHSYNDRYRYVDGVQVDEDGTPVDFEGRS